MASKVPDFDIVLTPLRTRRGEICARGKSVEIARGKLSDDYMALAINELLPVMMSLDLKMTITAPRLNAFGGV